MSDGTDPHGEVAGHARDEVDEAARREAEDARREAEALRRDREKADRLAAREADRARRDQEKADRTAQKDAERVAKEASKETERLQREARDAAREAGRAQREAEQAERTAALARQRAAREAEKALRQAQRAEPETAVVDRSDLPPDVAVLWRAPAPARRGPRPGLTLEQIADAGIALADAEGLDAVSMARLAESLGFTTMSLYRYVSSKDDVLMLMSDRASGRPPVVGPEVGGWRARLELLLGLSAPILGAHPWMSRTTALLFAVGPNRLAWMEAMVAALEETALTEAEKLLVVGALSGHQLERARMVDAELTRQRSVAASAGDEGSAPDLVIERLVDPVQHPAMSRVVAAGVFRGEPDADAGALDFGTRLILDGAERLVESASSR
ncbi:TetR/AcrR family transcriptional regulator [Cellulomonas sp. HZM]|uniref:TetR/AcrR family transcriptional regulator n=1 Tax=Cellulomonas sp. HZM TaxID=1454010 RepID=UPI000690F891|nr:TetR/AcrR family transcriptional regulator [Cellulomonas sp. HZM]